MFNLYFVSVKPIKYDSEMLDAERRKTRSAVDKMQNQPQTVGEMICKWANAFSDY